MLAAGPSGLSVSNGQTYSATLGLGGNIGDVVDAMRKALDRLHGQPGLQITKISSLYKTPPWGIKNQNWFVNSCVEISTSLSPLQLLAECLETEKHLKRVRTLRWGPRTIDIDVLTIDDYESDDPKLTVPHPRMLQRAFVLIPLAEITPDLMIKGENVAHWRDLADRSGIEKIKQDGDWWKPQEL